MTDNRVTQPARPRSGGSPPRRRRLVVGIVVALAGALLAVPVGAGAEGHGLTGVVYSLDTAPDGSFLVTENASVMEVRGGVVGHVATLPTAMTEEIDPETGEPVVVQAPVNGITTIGRGNYFVTTGGLDATDGAGLWRVSRGDHRLVADISAFELDTDPDSLEGMEWKDHACEEVDGWTPGPQSNPYQLTALSGSEVLIGDAAGNSLLWAKSNGEVDWVALPPPAYHPAVDPEAPERDRWLVQHEDVVNEDGEEIDCYVQPVPTGVDVGPDGDYYFGELTGTPPDPFGDPTEIAGLARVWRVEADARNVSCPSDHCEMVFDGLTSVMDVEFGPDGRLYVVEMDANGWFAAVVLGDFAGGTVKACDLDTGDCETVEAGIPTPSALTFDRQGNLWIAESMFFQPQIRRVDLG